MSYLGSLLPPHMHQETQIVPFGGGWDLTGNLFIQPPKIGGGWMKKTTKVFILFFLFTFLAFGILMALAMIIFLLVFLHSYPLQIIIGYVILVFVICMAGGFLFGIIMTGFFFISLRRKITSVLSIFSIPLEYKRPYSWNSLFHQRILMLVLYIMDQWREKYVA